MKRTLQILIQIAFLALFIFLIIVGKVQLWMGVFILGLLASLFLGRIYCGWICPINTAMIGVTWVKKKLHLKSLKIPNFLKKTGVRYLALALFILAFVFTLVSGKKLPILPLLFAIGVVITFLFPEELWHRYLCPYGTILHLPAKLSRRKLSVDPDQCNNCGACIRICPAVAVAKGKHNHEIIKEDCILCMKCIDNCKQGAIGYQ